MDKKVEGLYGLVLAGGKSRRMGKDKSQISYHGQPQSRYLYHLLAKFCQKTFLSIRQDQIDQYDDSYQLITDQDKFKGPFNGLLSAHDHSAEASWLVVACDLPLMDEDTIGQLITERDSSKMATALATRKTGLPEPLAAIWEANGLEKVPPYLREAESSCPRKYLLNSDIKLVTPKDDKVLLNANFEEEYEAVMKILDTV